MTIGLLPTPAGRREIGDSLRRNALDPGFHDVQPVRHARIVRLMVLT
jgi:hypothetical protein